LILIRRFAMHIITSRTLECRRRFLGRLGAAGAFYSITGLFAEALTLTPQQTQGPFYPLPDDLPLGRDNDLLYLNDNITPAIGTITWVSGRVLDSSGNPIRDALVELWQADNGGTYTYSAGPGRNSVADPNFAGFGQYLTGSSGGYKFRTIKPGPYPGRTRHLHFGITLTGRTRFTTQLYWAGEPANANDGVLNGISNAEQRASVVRPFTAVPGSATGEEETTWDIVMGQTPIEPTHPGGSLVVAGTIVSGPPGGNPRYKVSIPAYAGFSYEIYANPTLGNLAWAALPFALSPTGAIDRNISTAASNGTLDIYVEAKSVRGFYFIAFRLPGANTGTP
jgi:protocatechuate 3,4-dioxygenase beta subunit